ncbi:UNVERIFIED_CONTAM: hypothetical protein FKN15_022682 [Acipenser sinensis]
MQRIRQENGFSAGVDDEDDEADYENIEDSIEMEEKKTNQTEAFKEELTAQAATTGVDDEDDEADYENIEDSIEQKEKKTNRTEAFKEELTAQAATTHNVCGTKSIVFLYVLLIASSVMWAALLSLLFVKLCANTCSGSWNLFNGAFYYFSKENKVWKEARTFCQSQNSDLAVINSEEELKYLQDKGPANELWLGLSDSDNEGTWKWLDGRVVEKRTCPCDWKEFSGKCYYFSKGERDWQKAKEFCYNQDAVLAMVKTQQELVRNSLSQLL